MLSLMFVSILCFNLLRLSFNKANTSPWLFPRLDLWCLFGRIEWLVPLMVTLDIRFPNYPIPNYLRMHQLLVSSGWLFLMMCYEQFHEYMIPRHLIYELYKGIHFWNISEHQPWAWVLEPLYSLPNLLMPSCISPQNGEASIFLVNIQNCLFNISNTVFVYGYFHWGANAALLPVEFVINPWYCCFPD